MRYDAEWLLECLLLRIKSSGVYNHLYNLKILALPHPDTLRRMLGGISCHFGFNKFALDAIKKMMDQFDDPEDCWGVLSLDEIAIGEDLDFNTQSHNFDGFVHLEPDAPESCTPTRMDEDEDTAVKRGKIDIHNLADHALVIMYRPLFSNWVQPIGSFGSRGAASGEDLFRLLLSALIQLEGRGARVLAVVSDGAQSNKAMWKLAGVGVAKAKDGGEVNNSMIHPTARPDQPVYFLLDPPHAFKCIRNQIFNHKIVQVLFIPFLIFNWFTA